MNHKPAKQRYTYFFIDRYTKKILYATVAYSFLQAVDQLCKRHPYDEIAYKVSNNVFDYDRKGFIPKEKPEPEQKSYKQLDFKGFTDSNSGK